jgi:multidrug efflux pump
MSLSSRIQKTIREFKPTSWAIDNRTAVYIIAILISWWGYNRFMTLPKEQFPDIVVPTISVTTVYVGNSPSKNNSRGSAVRV